MGDGIFFCNGRFPLTEVKRQWQFFDIRFFQYQMFAPEQKLFYETCIQQPTQQEHDYSMQVPSGQIIK
jgi:hypothetical protein